MKVVPWIIVVFMIYIIYYFVSRAEKRLNALEKRLNNLEENFNEIRKIAESNKLAIENQSSRAQSADAED